MEKKYILIIAKFSITIFLFYLIIKNIDFQKISVVLNSFDVVYFLWAMGILLFQIIIAAARWRVILEKLNIKFTLTKVLNSYHKCITSTS